MPQIVTPSFAYTPNEAWLWNGLQLQQPYMNLVTFGGSRSGIPTLRGQDIPVPYRAGQSWRAKYPDSRTVSLTMWTDGSGSAAGWPSSNARLAFNDNWAALRKAFFTRGGSGSVQGQLQRNWYLTAGGPGLVTSTAMAEIAGSMDLTMSGRTGAAFTVDLLLADPMFYGTLQTVACTGVGGTTVTGKGEGVVGEGFPSPVATFSVQCSAPCTVTNATAGLSFTLASGPSYPVTVDVLNGLISDNGGASVPAKFSHSGGRLWMTVLPGANTIQVSAGTATFNFNDVYI